MSRIKRIAWLSLWFLIAAGVGAETVRGDDVSGPRPESPAPVLLDFYADWCGPCQSMTPTIESLARAGYPVRRINIDHEPGLAREYGVNAIPCFVVVERAAEIDRVTGVTTIERLKLKLDRKLQVPRSPSPIPRPPSPAPHPAWRYERPVGHRAAVVRIFCGDCATTRSIGSGVLVKWNGGTVVLTACHVIKDAKNILVWFSTGKMQRARVLSTDATWDVAVLEVDGSPAGVEPVAVELGREAMQQEGSHLESCGYGPDGRLACNSGLFLGYRRSSAAPHGPDDWMIISGHARGGDSGGPVFNERGRLVGVLWGTDGKEVVCIQAGRLHLLLDAAAPARTFQQQADVISIPIEQLPEADACKTAEWQRSPTPPKEPPCAGGPCCPPTAVDETAAYGKKRPLIKWRDGAQKKDAELDARIEALIALQERQAKAAVAPAKPEGPVGPDRKIEVKKEDASPAVAAIVILGGLAVGGIFYSLTKKKTT